MKCGWHGGEITNGNYITIWKEGKTVAQVCLKCAESREFGEYLKGIFGTKS